MAEDPAPWWWQLSWRFSAPVFLLGIVVMLSSRPKRLSLRLGLGLLVMAIAVAMVVLGAHFDPNGTDG